MVRIGCLTSGTIACVVSLSSVAVAGPPPPGALFASEPTTVFTAMRPYGIVVDDFDDDGNRDFLVDELSTLTLYFMNADDSVRETVSYSGETLDPSAPLDQLYLETVDSVGIRSADMTGDGLPEIILVEESDVRVLSVSTAGFQMITNTRAVDYVPLTAVGRFTSSNASQLILEPSHDAEPYELQVLNLSSGSLVETQRLADGGIVSKSSGGFSGNPIDVFDLNSDGKDDLVYPGVQSAIVRLQAAAGGLGGAVSLALSGELRSIAAGHFDTDGRLDLALVGGYPAELHTERCRNIRRVRRENPELVSTACSGLGRRRLLGADRIDRCFVARRTSVVRGRAALDWDDGRPPIDRRLGW
jgi:hypothetical protein